MTAPAVKMRRTRRRRAGGVVAVVLLLLTAACAQEDWWAAEWDDDPCALELEGVIERATGLAVRSAEVIHTDVGTRCDHRLTGDATVNVNIFPAGTDTVEALSNGRTSWTPGSTSGTGYQGLHRYPGEPTTIYVRAVAKSVAADVALTLDATDDELIAAGESIALVATDAVLARR